jgi:hypothetical protein
MPSSALNNLIVALLHEVTSPRRRRCCGHCGGRRHRRSVVAPASPPPLLPLAMPQRRVLERPPSPSPNRPVNRPLLSDPGAHPRGRQGGPCAVHSWDCPNRVARVHDPSSLSRQGEEEGGKDEYDERQISVVTGPIGALAIRRTTLPSGSGMPPDLRSPCGNWLLRRFTHLAAPSG